MRVLSAVNHKGIEGYISCIPGISSLDTASDRRALMDMSASATYDLVIISQELSGNADMKSLMEAITVNRTDSRRYAFLYGDADSNCDDFCRFLVSLGIYDFHVGDELSSKVIERLVFRPGSRLTAIGYINSSYDNESYFGSQNINHSRTFNKSIKKLLNRWGKSKPVLDKVIVSIISNHATGKSHTAWNLACCLSGRGYATSMFNIDRGYSANLYFSVDELYYDLLEFTIRNNAHKGILDSCLRRKSLKLITGKPGDEAEIAVDDFTKLLYSIRTQSDITVIDTRTGLTPLTRHSVKSSTYDLLIFDCDSLHFHMNMKMLEGLKDDFVPEKTIAVINNTNIRSKAHKNIYNQLVGTGIPFRDVAFISSCGLAGNEAVLEGVPLYNKAGGASSEFSNEIDRLADKLSGRNAHISGPFGI